MQEMLFGQKWDECICAAMTGFLDESETRCSRDMANVMCSVCKGRGGQGMKGKGKEIEMGVIIWKHGRMVMKSSWQRWAVRSDDMRC